MPLLPVINSMDDVDLSCAAFVSVGCYLESPSLSGNDALCCLLLCAAWLIDNGFNLVIFGAIRLKSGWNLVVFL